MRCSLRLTLVATAACLVLAGCDSAPQPLVHSAPSRELTCPAGRQLAEHITNSLWQWDGAGGEKITFNANRLVENEGWTARKLVTRWQVIDRRTVLFEIESGRSRDSYAVLTFNEDMSSFDGFNFHGQTRIKPSLRLD